MKNELTALEIQSRIDNLIAMDNVMRNLNDEDLVMVWLAEGIPDMAVEQEDWDILCFIATSEDEDKSAYDDIVKLYKELLAESSEEE
jgi:hypothetical protein